MAEHAMGREVAARTAASAARRAPAARRAGAAPERRPVGPAGGAIGPDVAARISSSQGQPLDDRLRARMEHVFGTGLADVRIHRQSAMAPELGARAFTLGTDIHFAPGEWRPETPDGSHLVAHELAHVVQQGATARPSRIQPSLVVGPADDPLEREADSVADLVMARLSRQQPALADDVAGAPKGGRAPRIRRASAPADVERGPIDERTVTRIRRATSGAGAALDAAATSGATCLPPVGHDAAHCVRHGGGRTGAAARTVRRTLDDATAYAGMNGISGIATSDDVTAYVGEDGHPFALRQALLESYNRGLADDQQLKLVVPPDAVSTPSLMIVPQPNHQPVALVDAMATALTTLDVAALFLAQLSSQDLWSFAQTGKASLAIARRFARTYLPAYEDRFQFNLATKGLLLIEPLEDKWGGKKHEGKPHATSGWTWYQAGRKGAASGPLVLGAIPDYRAMREYTSYVRDEKGAASIEENARYLMAFPWSLLVNAALLTGAIHARRTIIGATDPLDPKKLWGAQYGVTVYARELIQLVLLHGYAPGSDKGLAYPEPAIGGGLALHPPEERAKGERRRPSATVFDAEEAVAARPDYQDKANNGATLVADLGAKLPATAYKPIEYDPVQQADIKKKKAASDVKYKALRKQLASYQIDGVPKPATPAPIATIITTIYPNPPKCLVTIPTLELNKLIADARLAHVPGLDAL
jgi:hypothetical protein